MVSALWSNAVEMGRVAGTNMAGGKVRYEGFLSVLNASDIAGIPFISAGVVNDEAGRYEVYSVRDGENYRKVLFDGERLVGFLLRGGTNRAGILTHLIKNQRQAGKLKTKVIEGMLHYGHFLKAIY